MNHIWSISFFVNFKHFLLTLGPSDYTDCNLFEVCGPELRWPKLYAGSIVPIPFCFCILFFRARSISPLVSSLGCVPLTARWRQPWLAKGQHWRASIRCKAEYCSTAALNAIGVISVQLICTHQRRIDWWQILWGIGSLWRTNSAPLTWSMICDLPALFLRWDFDAGNAAESVVKTLSLQDSD